MGCDWMAKVSLISTAILHKTVCGSHINNLTKSLEILTE